jgi:hypothetical protein
MKAHEFAILHELKGTQFLVNTAYDEEDENPYSLTMKMWCNKVGGYVDLKLGWPERKKKDFVRTFEALRSKEKAMDWYTKINK